MTRMLIPAVLKPCATSLVVWCVIVGSMPNASAQTRVPPGRIEVAVGLTWLGESDLAVRDANLTTGTGGSSRLFTTSTTLGSSSGFEARVGGRVWRSLDAELLGTYTKPVLRTTVSNDVEGAAGVTATDSIRQYTVGGGATWYLPYRTNRLATFVTGSASYLRQLHEGDALAVTGRVYEAGAGAKYFFVSRSFGRLNAFGVRADARVQARARGVALDDAVHYRPVLAVAVFARF